MTNARKRIAINVSVIGGECSIDRDGIGIKEGFDGDVDLVFTFNDPSSSDDADASWSDRPIRKISIINNERIYTSTLIGDEFTIPRHMLKRGKLLFIVRGFKNKELSGVNASAYHGIDMIGDDNPDGYIEVSNIEDVIFIN